MYDIMRPVATRPGVRGGSSTRGFPPGSSQALVALVLGVVIGVTGVRRGEWPLGIGFLLLGLLGAVALVRLLLSGRR